MQRQVLPPGKQAAYAFGMMGWSIMFNLIGVILVYLYVPPTNSGLPVLITQAVLFGFFNMAAIIMIGSRLADALYDPLIAQVSDKSKNPRGRRIPLMRKAILPSLVFCFLIFYPLKDHQSTVNVIWLVFTLICFYASTTTYIIPYYALLPELAPTPHDKMRLSTWQSVGYVFGIGIASNTFSLADLLQHSFGVSTRLAALQISVLIMAVLASIFMAVTAFAIDEKKYCVGKPSAVPMMQALRHTLTNKNFLYFITADFSYFISITLITAGLPYFIKVLLGLPESIGNMLMITMVLVSFIFYPVTNILARRVGKKPVVAVSLCLLAMVFVGVYFLGKLPLPPKLQIFLLIGFAAIPLASLNILPNAILSEVIEKDSFDTQDNKEATYFAVRFFFVKMAQTFGGGLFAMLLIYGKDEGHDTGIRLNGILGFMLCLLAALIFSRFKEIHPVMRKK